MALTPRLVVRLPAPAFRSEGSIGVNVNARWLDPVRFVATTGTLGALVNGASYAGLTLATGDRFLYQPTSGGSSTPGVTNGIYVVGVGAPTRATDADSGSELFNASVLVLAGSPGAGQSWVNVNSSTPTVGTDTIIFRQFTQAPTEKVTVETRAQGLVTSIPTSATVVQTLGYATGGDGGGATYKKVGSPPAHAGKFQSADGAWWEEISDFPSPKKFGAQFLGVVATSTELQAAVDRYATGTSGTGPVSGYPPKLSLGNGKYLISTTLTIPNAIHIQGDGRSNTVIQAAPGFTGIMVRDKGNASKIILSDFQIFANDEAGVTDLLNLGNITSPWGTSGRAQGLLLRGGSSATLAGSCGLRHKSNVISVLDCHTQWTADGIIETANTNVTWYDDISVLGATGTSIYTIGQSTIGRLEVEAPGAASTGVYVSRDAHIVHMVYSQAAAVANTNAIVIDNAALRFSMGAFTHFTNSGSTLANVISDLRTGHAAWGQSVTTGTIARKEGVISDTLHVGSQNVFVQGGKLQNFKLRITKTTGVMQHRISGLPSNSVVGDYQSQITGASVALTNTPTATDTSTAFAAGGKISSVSTNAFIFDVAAQDTADKDAVLMASIVFNSTGTALSVVAGIANRDVNGVTRRRLEFNFYNATTGAAYGLSSLADGNVIDVQFLGFFV